MSDNTKHFLFHSNGVVKLIRGEDLPVKKTCGGKGFCCDWNVPCEALKYPELLATALEEKGVVVTNAFVLPSLITSILKENMLHELPDSWEVKFEGRCVACSATHNEDCNQANTECEESYEVFATLHPAAPKEEGKTESQEEELWDDVENKILDCMYKYYGAHSESISGQLAFNMKEAIKKEFSLTRKT